MRPSPQPMTEWRLAENFCTIAYDDRMVPITCVGPFTSMDLALACGDDMRDRDNVASVMVYPMQPAPQGTLPDVMESYARGR